jgi:hypothetical protein
LRSGNFIKDPWSVEKNLAARIRHPSFFGNKFYSIYVTEGGRPLCLYSTCLELCEFDCPVGYNEFDFFLENKEYRPLMGAKLKSKTHLQNTFFDFLSRFLRV